MTKWLVRIAAVLGIAGIIGTVILLDNKDTVSAETNKTDSTNTTTSGTSGTPDSNSAYASAYQTTPAAETSTPVTEPVKDEGASSYTSSYGTPEPTTAPVEEPKPVETAKPVASTPAPSYTATPTPAPVRKAEPVKKAQPIAAVAKKVTTPKIQASSKEDKIFTTPELQSMVKQIVEKGDENNIYLKCVQLHRSSSGNNERTAVQVENFLKTQGYTIAGRETTSRQVKGMQIAPGNGCMKLILGTF